MVIEKATLHPGTCTRSRVITYRLDSSSWIHGAMHEEDRVEYNSGLETATLHAGTCMHKE